MPEIISITSDKTRLWEQNYLGAIQKSEERFQKKTNALYQTVIGCLLEEYEAQNVSGSTISPARFFVLPALSEAQEKTMERFEQTLSKICHASDERLAILKDLQEAHQMPSLESKEALEQYFSLHSKEEMPEFLSLKEEITELFNGLEEETSFDAERFLNNFKNCLRKNLGDDCPRDFYKELDDIMIMPPKLLPNMLVRTDEAKSHQDSSFFQACIKSNKKIKLALEELYSKPQEKKLEKTKATIRKEKTSKLNKKFFILIQRIIHFLKKWIEKSESTASKRLSKTLDALLKTPIVKKYFKQIPTKPPIDTNSKAEESAKASSRPKARPQKTKWTGWNPAERKRVEKKLALVEKNRLNKGKKEPQTPKIQKKHPHR